MKRLLLVDDDPNILESAKDILEDAGYAVKTASTLAAARALLAEGALDVLVVDFNLPDGKGLNLALEAKSQWPALKRVLMTGEVPVATGGADTGLFHAVLTKPVDPPSLLALLAAFDRSGETPS